LRRSDGAHIRGFGRIPELLSLLANPLIRLLRYIISYVQLKLMPTYFKNSEGNTAREKGAAVSDITQGREL
jgi:hypothetical protein